MTKYTPTNKEKEALKEVIKNARLAGMRWAAEQALKEYDLTLEDLETDDTPA